MQFGQTSEEKVPLITNRILIKNMMMLYDKQRVMILLRTAGMEFKFSCK